MKLLIAFLMAALLAFAAWPYYRVYQLDDALGNDDVQALTYLVDLRSIRERYGERLSKGIAHLSPAPNQNPAFAWLNDQLKRLGNAALDQAITLEWVMETLREAASRHSDRPTPYFISGISFAFFESWDSFLIRLGEIGDNAVHVRLRLQDGNWRVTDIIQGG